MNRHVLISQFSGLKLQTVFAELWHVTSLSSLFLLWASTSRLSFLQPFHFLILLLTHKCYLRLSTSLPFFWAVFSPFLSHTDPWSHCSFCLLGIQVSITSLTNFSYASDLPFVVLLGKLLSSFILLSGIRRFRIKLLYIANLILASFPHFILIAWTFSCLLRLRNQRSLLILLSLSTEIIFVISLHWFLILPFSVFPAQYFLSICLHYREQETSLISRFCIHCTSCYQNNGSKCRPDHAVFPTWQNKTKQKTPKHCFLG